jgi:hypothetical protein
MCQAVDRLTFDYLSDIHGKVRLCVSFANRESESADYTCMVLTKPGMLGKSFHPVNATFVILWITIPRGLVFISRQRRPICSTCASSL